jgi:hypothetical protein
MMRGDGLSTAPMISLGRVLVVLPLVVHQHFVREIRVVAVQQ